MKVITTVVALLILVISANFSVVRGEQCYRQIRARCNRKLIINAILAWQCYTLYMQLVYTASYDELANGTCMEPLW